MFNVTEYTRESRDISVDSMLMDWQYTNERFVPTDRCGRFNDYYGCGHAHCRSHRRARAIGVSRSRIASMIVFESTIVLFRFRAGAGMALEGLLFESMMPAFGVALPEIRIGRLPTTQALRGL